MTGIRLHIDTKHGEVHKRQTRASELRLSWVLLFFDTGNMKRLRKQEVIMYQSVQGACTLSWRVDRCGYLGSCKFCAIWGSQSGDNKEHYILGCDCEQSCRSVQTFRGQRIRRPSKQSIYWLSDRSLLSPEALCFLTDYTAQSLSKVGGSDTGGQEIPWRFMTVFTDFNIGIQSVESISRIHTIIL